MTEVIYAVEEYRVEQRDIVLMEVKIGYSENLEGRIRTFQSFSRTLEVLNIWKVNNEKEIQTFEDGIHELAEKYAHKRESENFVFVDEQYQKFANVLNKIAEPVSREELKEVSKTDDKEDFLGTTPKLLEFGGDEYNVSTWRETVQKAAKHAIENSENSEKILDIEGPYRKWFTKDENREQLRAAKNIPDTDFSFEGQRNADQLRRTIDLIAEKFDIDKSDVSVKLE